MLKGNPQRTKLPLWKKTILVFFGIIFSILLLEISLRLGGLVFLSLQECRNRAAIFKKGTYRIMCLGESTTAIGGRDSYPSQLEEILNQRKVGINFSVINAGLVAVDTTGIISHLEENLNKYEPDMVTVMMGINDHCIKYYEDIPDANTALFDKFRAYRLARILWEYIVKKIKKAPSLISTVELQEHSSDYKNVIQREEVLKKAIEFNPKDVRAYMELGLCYREQGRHIQSEEKPSKKP